MSLGKNDENKLYRVYCTMKQRCLNPKNHKYKRYGGRGITIHTHWLNSFWSFQRWSLANGYVEGLSIDREDNDGNYEPSNCRWVTGYTQAQNTVLLCKSNTSGFRGVFPSGKKWMAKITANGVNNYLGTFITKELAAKAYNNFVDTNSLETTKNII